MIESTEIKISEIRTDGGTQPRAQLNWITVNEYAESIIDGATLPPVEVVYDGKDYWLWDGFHRVEAHKKAECVSVRANVKQGTRRDAVLLSVGANSSHGLQRTMDDKRRAVMTLLNDAEWAKWSNREIARQCKVSDPFVGKMRSEMHPILTANVSSENNGRTYTTKHGTVATMNTANIGKAPTPPVGTVKLTPPPATTVLAPKPALAPAVPTASKPAGEVVRSETRFTLAPPIRDDEFDDMVNEAEEDADGYDWQDEEDIEEYTPPVKVAPTVKVPEWTPSQIGRRARVEKGFTVHANMKTDVALIEWAKQTGRFARVDRATEWGNPFHLPDDGDRETVIANYEWYMQKKPSLMKKIGTLKGKVLGCWCHPEPCHAGFLEDLTNDDFFVHSEVKDEGDQVGDADKFYQSENDLENY